MQPTIGSVKGLPLLIEEPLTRSQVPFNARKSTNSHCWYQDSCTKLLDSHKPRKIWICILK